jgi:hypothetical protein
MLRHMRLGRPLRRKEDLLHPQPASGLPPATDPHEIVVDVRER